MLENPGSQSQADRAKYEYSQLPGVNVPQTNGIPCLNDPRPLVEGNINIEYHDESHSSEFSIQESHKMPSR